MKTTAESQSSPQTIQKIAPNKYYYNYNIVEVEQEVEGGGIETIYQYNYVEIEGIPTKTKVISAIKKVDDLTEADHNTAINFMIAKQDIKTSVLANKTNTQIENYIDNNVVSLASAKDTIKILAIEIRNIIRRQGWE